MARQPIDEMSHPVPDAKEAWRLEWGGRLDEYHAKVQQIKLQAKQQHKVVAADLESQLGRIRSCVDDVENTSADEWTKLTERCEQQWRDFEAAYHAAETKVGGISDQPQAGQATEDTNCRGHGGQPGHQTTRECPP